MGYQEYWVTANTSSTSFPYLASVLAGFLIACSLYLLARHVIRMKKLGLKPHFVYYLALLLLIITLPISILEIVDPVRGPVGWELEGHRLSIVAPPVSTTIDVRGAKLSLADLDSPWRPTLRTNGYGTSDLSTGWFKLANGEKTVVFRHLSPEKLLVIESQDSYYVLAHPGVDELYERLAMDEEAVVILAAEAASRCWYVLGGGNAAGGHETFEMDGMIYRYLGKDLGTKEKLLNYLSEVFTEEVQSTLLHDYGIIEHQGKMAQPEADGGSLLEWDQARAFLIDEGDGWKQYELNVPYPVGDDVEYEIISLEVKLTDKGWRLNSLVF